MKGTQTDIPTHASLMGITPEMVRAWLRRLEKQSSIVTAYGRIDRQWCRHCMANLEGK